MDYALSNSYSSFMCIVINPPGANNLMFLKFTSFIVNNDSISDNPVSDAPTTTILELLLILVCDNYFFDRSAKENGAGS